LGFGLLAGGDGAFCWAANAYSSRLLNKGAENVAAAEAFRKVLRVEVVFISMRP